MTAKRQRSGQGWASLSIAALAAGLVIAGLALGGGPAQARKERRDEARFADLERLAQHITCLSRDGQGRVMPTDLAEAKGCPGPIPLIDPLGGAPYRFEPINGYRYKLCANFEVPQKDSAYRWPSKLRVGDCVIETLPPPERDAVALPSIPMPIPPPAP